MAKTLSTASGWIWLDTVDPGVSETNVSQGNFWLNTSSKDFFICKDPAIDSQVWEKYVISQNVTSFTPSVIGTSVGGEGTYNTQSGYWTQSDNRVFVDLVLDWSAHTGSGDIRITGLPAPVNASTSPVCMVQLQNITLPGSSLMTWGNLSGSQLDLVTSRDNGTVQAIALPSAGIIKASFSYFA